MANSIKFTITGVGSAKVIKDFNDITKSIEQAKKEQRALQNQLDLLRDRSVGNRGAKQSLVTQLTGDPTQTRQAISTVKKGIEDLDKAIVNLSSRRNVQIVPPNNVIDNHRKKIKELSNAYYELARAGQANSPKANNLLTRLRQEATQLREIQSKINEATQAPKQQKSLLGNFGSTLAAVGAFKIASTLINKLTEGIQYAEETVRKFDEALTNLSSILSSSDFERIGELENQALVLGQTTAFTAGQVVALQTELSKLGFSVDAILNATPAIVSFSTAVGQSADRVATLTGATLKAFNIASFETTRVVNTLTRGIISTALSFTYLETALPIVSSASLAANVSLEETVAVLGLLADNGVQASTAGTAFRNILIESEKRGLAYKDALDLINNSANKLVTAFDLFGKRGAVQALILARDRAAELNAVLAASGEIVDESGKRTEETMGRVTKSVAAFSDELQDKLKTAKEVADIQLTSIQGNITLLKSAWDGFLLAVGNTDAYKNATKGFLQFATTSLNGLSAIIDGTVDAKGAAVLLYQNLRFGTSTIKETLETINDIAQSRRAAEQVATEQIQKQAQLRTGIFKEGLAWTDNLRAQRDLQEDITSLLVQGGFDDVEAAARATNLIKTQVKSLKAEIADLALRAREEEVRLLEFSERDIKSVQSIASAKQVLESFQEAVNNAGQNTAQFTKFLRLRDIAQARLNELEEAAGKNIKENKTELESLEQTMGKYLKRLRDVSTESERNSIVEKITTLQTKLNQNKDAYENYIKQLNDATLKLLPDQLAKQILDLEISKINLRKDSEIAKQKLSLDAETVTAEKIKAINLRADIDIAQQRLRILKEGSPEYEKAILDLQEKFAEAFRVNSKITIEIKNFELDIQSAQGLLEIEKLVTNEYEKKFLIENLELRTSRDKLNNELRILESKRQQFDVVNTLIGVNLQLTDSEKLRYNQLLLQSEELKKQEALLKDVDLQNLKTVDNQANLQDLKDILDLYAQFNRGEIKGTPTTLFSEVKGTTDLQAFTDQLELLKAAQKVANDERQLEIVAQEEKTLGILLDASERYKAQKIKLEESYLALKLLINKKDEDATERAERAKERRLRQTADAIEKFAVKSGEAIGAALVNEEGTKEAFKSLLKDMIDILATAIRGQLVLELTKALATLNVPNIIAITAGIAAISAAAGAAKAGIDRFEYGGKTDDGVVRGKSHKMGGVKARTRKGRMLELEGGEFVVNKLATARNLPLLEQINKSKNHYGSFIKSNKYAIGGIIESPPNIVGNQNNSLTLSSDSIREQAATIASEISNAQVGVLVQQNATLVEAMVKALDSIEKLNVRRRNSEKNSRI